MISKNCNISYNDCEKSKKYKRPDIDKIAEDCGIVNSKEYKNRKVLCQAIVNKNLGKPHLPDQINIDTNLNCNIEEKKCNRQTRGELYKLAEKCNIKDPKNKKLYPTIKDLCNEIIKKQNKTPIVTPPLKKKEKTIITCISYQSK